MFVQEMKVFRAPKINYVTLLPFILNTLVPIWKEMNQTVVF